jgi:hypothetical protein
VRNFEDAEVSPITRITAALSDRAQPTTRTKSADWVSPQSLGFGPSLDPFRTQPFAQSAIGEQENHATNTVITDRRIGYNATEKA